MTIEALQADPKAELFDKVRYDTVYYSKLKFIGLYHDTEEKAIVQRPFGKITKLKIRGKGFIAIDGARMYLKYFKESEENWINLVLKLMTKLKM